MGQTAPRIPPAESLSVEQKELLGDWSDMNFARVIVNHPSLYRAFVPLIAKVIPHSDLPPRDRQVIALRTLSFSNEVYEVTHQVEISRNAGLSEAEIEAARTGGPGLEPFHQTLVQATEELVREQRVRDETWARLAERYSTVEIMEVVALVGCYTMMAMVTQSYEIQLEEPEVFHSFPKRRNYV